MPLIRQTWLARKPNKYVAYKIEANGPGSEVHFRVASKKNIDELGFNPSVGTSRGGIATCPCCGSPLSDPYIKAQAVAGHLNLLAVAVVGERSTNQGKGFRDVTEADRQAFLLAQERLIKLQAGYDPFSGELTAVPDEPVPTNDVFNVRLPIYGLMTWGSIYNERQALALATLARQVRNAFHAVMEESGDAEYAKAITTYLAIILDRHADYNSSVQSWDTSREQPGHTFGRQAIPMVWDYCEVNSFSGGAGSWDSAMGWVTRYIEHGAATSSRPAEVVRGTAAQLPYPDGHFDAVVTDPPYYNNVGYSSLADFFYVWLKRTLGEIHPTVVGAPAVPKEQEIVEGGQMHCSKAWFEEELGHAFAECARVLRDDGICTVVYAHKAITAWESLVAALLKAGLTVDASWPFSTEMASRQMASNKAALASSIFLVCRKRHVDAGVGYASDVRAAITTNVRERLNAFWDAGLRGADFFISAIGPATAAFSRYTKVETLAGTEVTVSTLLQWVQEEVADYALGRVFTRGAATSGVDAGLGDDVDDATRFYVLWRWTYDGAALGGPVNGATPNVPNADGVDDAEDETESGGAAPKPKSIPFGDAHLMAIALGANIADLTARTGLLEGSSSVKLLTAAERAVRYPNLGERRTESRTPLIDIIHRAELLWTHGNEQELADYLDEVLPLDREPFRRVAQALVDLLPRGDVEKQRLEGLLAGKVADGSGGAGSQTPPATQTGFIEIGQQDVTRGTRGRK